MKTRREVRRRGSAAGSSHWAGLGAEMVGATRIRGIACLLGATAAFLLSASPAAADVPGVNGETVVFGNVTFIRDGNQLYIQASDGSIINYAAFNIAAGELVQFLQPGPDSRVLNRILGVGPSEIDGQLLANGIVYIVNPAGVIFGADSVIDVGGIYASAAGITDSDFLNGIDQFTLAAGDVVNRGTIQAGQVHLLGRQVRNHGDINAPSGLVTMLAGESFLIGEVGGQLLVHVDGSDVAGDPAGTSGVDPSITSDAGVLNDGTITVGDGHAFLAAGDLYSLGVHNIGEIQAGGGRVSMASGDGVVYNAGTVDVSDASQAGSVLMRAPTVINGGLVSAASDAGQGGLIEMLGHDHVYLFQGSTTTAGGGSGVATGGTILLIAQDGLMFLSQGALADVSGGAAGGDGGFLETSGSQLILEGEIDLAAASGWAPGLMFIDPFDIVIGADGSDNPLVSDGTITFAEGDNTPGAQSLISAAFLSSLNGAILLQANNDIFINTQIDLTTNSNSIAFEAIRDVIFNANIIGATGLDVDAGRFIQFQGAGGIDFDVAGAINLEALTILVNGSILGNGITVTGDLEFTSGAGGADQVFDARTGALLITGDVTKTDGGLLTLGGATGITITGDLGTDVGGLDVEDELTLGGDADVAADARFRDTVTLSAGGAQSLAAGGSLRTDGTVTKAAGDLTLSGASLDLNDDVEATAGALALTGAADAAGDLTAGTTIQVDNDLTLSAGGAQAVTAGTTLTADGTITKATGDLTLSGTSLDLNDDVEATAGALTLAGDADAAGDLTAGTAVQLDDDLTLSAGGAQAVTAGTTLTADGTITKATGDLTLSGTSLDLNDDVEATAGALTLTGAAAADGDLTAGTTIQLDNDLTLSGGGAQAVTAGTALTADGAITKATGDLTLSGTSLDLNDDVEATAGALTLTGDADAAGELTAGTTIQVDNDLTLSAGGAQAVTAGTTLTADGTITKATGDLTLSGTSLDLNDDVEATAGGLTLTGAAAADGDLTAGTTIQLDNDLTLSAGGAQAITAGTTLTADGTITKATGDLTLSGTSLDLNDDVEATAGALTLTGAADAAGDLTAGTTIQLDNDLTLSAGGAQAITAGTTLTADGTITKATGDLTLSGTSLDLNDDVEATAGALTLTGDADAVGDLTAGTAVQLDDDLTLSAGGAQAVTAGTALTADGTITKATGDLTLSGASLDLNDDVEATAGALTLTGAADAAGDLTAGTTIQLDNDLTLGGGGAQAVTAGTTLTADGTITKATGNLTLSGTSLDLNDDVEATSGALTLTGAADATGDLTAGTAIQLDNDLTLSGGGAQAVTAGTTLTADGTITKATGDLTLSGTSLDLNDDIEATAGALTLTGDADAAGELTAGTAVQIDNDLTLSAGGAQAVTAGTTLTADGTITKATGDLTLSGASLDLNDDVEATAGALTLTGAADADGDLTAGTTIQLDNDLTLGGGGAQAITAGTTLTADGTITKATGNLTLSGTSLDLNDDVEATAGALTLTGATDAVGDLTAGTTIQLDNDLTLSAGGAQAITAGTALTADGTITKATGDLTLSGTSLDLNDDVEATAGALTLTGDADAVGDLTAGTAVQLDDDLTLSAGGAQAVTAGTTLTADGTITKATGDLTLSGTSLDLNDDVSATAGTLNLSGTTAAAGDLTSGGDLTLGTLVTLDGAVTQRLTSGGILTITGGLTKATGDLELDATTAINVNGTITAGGGLTATSDDWNQTAQVSADSIDLTLDGTATVTGNLFATTMLQVRAGQDGTGDISVGAVALRGAMIVLDAGDGAGGGAGSQLIFNPGASFADAAGTGQAGAVVFRQDAALLASNLPGAGQFVGGTTGLDLTLESRDAAVTLDAVGPLTGTQLTVASAGDVTASVALALQSLNLTTTGTATFQQSLDVTGATDITGDLALQNTLTAGSLDVSGGLELGGNGAWTYTVTGDATVGGTLSFDGTGTRQFNAGGDIDLAGADLDGASAGTLAAGGDFTVTGPVSGTGAGGRTLSAVGTLTLDGAVQFDAGDVMLVGALIDLNDLVQVTGALTLDGLTQARGNITAGTSLAFLADLVLDANGVQVLTAGTMIMADGAVTKVQGNLELLAPQVTVAGTLAAGDDLTIDGTLTGAAIAVGQDLLLAGAGDQTISATTLAVGNDLRSSVSGDVTLTTTGGAAISGDVSVVGGGLEVTGVFQAIGGAITVANAIIFNDDATIGGDVTGGSTVDFMQAATLGGDLMATGAASFNDSLALSAAGTQTLSAGDTLRFAGPVTKTAGSLSLASGTLIRLEDTMSVGGNLVFGGPTELDLGGGRVQAGGSMAFANSLTLVSDVRLASTGSGDIATQVVNGPGGLRVETAGDTRLNADMNIGWIETVGGGRTIISGDIITSGRQTWSDEVTVVGSILFRSTGDDVIRFANTLTGGTAVEVRTGGDTIFDGQVDVGSLLTSGGGLTWLYTDQVTTSGDLELLDQVRLTRDTLLRSTSGGLVRLGGGLLGEDDDLRIETAGQTRLEGTIRTRRLETDAAGTLALGADIEVSDGFGFGESAATLVGDTILRDTSGDTMLVDFTVDGPHAIEFDSAGDLNLLRDIGATTRVESFTARTPGILTLGMDAIRATGDIQLNPDGRAEVPVAATIVAPNGSILFDSTGGDFIMGLREKLTVLGAIDIMLSGGSSRAVLSDMVSLGDMNVTAAQILLQLRGAGLLLDQFGLLSVDPDNGLDFVTGGVFRFSVAPTMIGSGAPPSFASADGLGDTNGNLSGFINQSFGEPITLDDLVTIVGEIFLDLRASGPTNANVSEAFASVIPRDNEIRDVPLETAIGATEIERLRKLSILAERPDDEEHVRNTEAGSAFYNDTGSLVQDVRAEVTVNRLLNDRVRDVLARFDRLLGTSEVAEVGGSDDGTVAVDRLAKAHLAYVGEDATRPDADPAAFIAWLEASGETELLSFLADMGSLFERIALLGLSDRESGIVRQWLTRRIRPPSMRLEELGAMIDLAASLRGD